MGGTFTDGFFTDGARTITCKVPTFRFDLTRSVVACLRAGADELGETFDAFLDRASIIRLASTVGTNAVVEGEGSRVGLLVEEGEEETLYSGRRADAIFQTFLDPSLVRGLANARDREALLRHCSELVHRGVRQVVVSLGGGEENADNERRIRDHVHGAYPEHYLRSIPLQLSSEVTACRDADIRTNTAVINAYLHRDMASLFHRAEQELRAEGLSVPLLVVHASSGVARIAKTTAISTYSSGPSAGLSGARSLAQTYGDGAVLTADMGGTTLDIGIIIDGVSEVDSRPRIAGVPVSLHMNRIVSIGCGGCSIASATSEGIRLGPESAGAVPGPAAFGRGGDRATLTDADVVLGMIASGRTFGGQFVINGEAAEGAIEREAAEIGGSSKEELAVAIQEAAAKQVSAAFVDALRARGVSPEDAVLYVFGGAGPLHAWRAALMAGIRTIRSFPFGSVFSAYGCTVVDVRHRYEFAWFGRRPEPQQLVSSLEQLLKRAIADVRGEGFNLADATAEISLLGKDGIELVSAVRTDHIDGGDLSTHVIPSLLEGLDDWSGVEVLLLEVSVPVKRPTHPSGQRRTTNPATPVDARPVWWESEPVQTPVYRWTDLAADQWLEGPLLVELEDTTQAVGPGWRFRVDRLGNGEWNVSLS